VQTSFGVVFSRFPERSSPSFEVGAPSTNCHRTGVYGSTLIDFLVDMMVSIAIRLCASVSAFDCESCSITHKVSVS
jgi:hypothetical protein